MSRAAPAPLRDGLPVHFHLGTEDVVARLAVLGARAIAPGESGFVQLDLEHPIAALWGDRAIIRDHAARHTLAGGRVLDPLAPRRGRSRPERLAALAALAEPDAGDALEKLVEAAGVVALAPFAWARNLPLAEIEALAEAAGLARFGTGEAAIAVSPERLAQLGEQIAAVLAEWHRAQPDALGPTRGALFARLRGQAPEAALDAALAAADRGRAGRARRRRCCGCRRISRGSTARTSGCGSGCGRCSPPTGCGRRGCASWPPELDMEPEKLTRFLRRVERFGRVAPVAPNRFFLPETVRELAELAASLADESPERQLYRRRVQGPLRHRPQPDDRGARISRPDRRDPARRRRPDRRCATPPSCSAESPGLQRVRRSAIDEQGRREGLDRVAVLVQRRDADLDDTLARARARGPGFEHLDLDAQRVAGAHRLGATAIRRRPRECRRPAGSRSTGTVSSSAPRCASRSPPSPSNSEFARRRVVEMKRLRVELGPRNR